MYLEDLAFKLNTIESPAGTRFTVEYIANTEILQVSCDNNPEAMIFIVKSDEQILSVTPLFKLSDVNAQRKTELFETLLRISPVIPLSSIGLQDDSCVLFGAMPVDSSLENIVHELECQADNYNDVLVALNDFFDTTQETVEV